MKSTSTMELGVISLWVIVNSQGQVILLESGKNKSQKKITISNNQREEAAPENNEE